MARPNLMTEKAEELAHFGIPVEPDVRMSGRWRLRLSRVLVALMSTVGTHGFVRAIGLYRARLSAEMLDDPW